MTWLCITRTASLLPLKNRDKFEGQIVHQLGARITTPPRRLPLKYTSIFEGQILFNTAYYLNHIIPPNYFLPGIIISLLYYTQCITVISLYYTVRWRLCGV